MNSQQTGSNSSHSILQTTSQPARPRLLSQVSILMQVHWRSTLRCQLTTCWRCLRGSQTRKLPTQSLWLLPAGSQSRRCA